MRAYFSRRYRFSASHRLNADFFSAEENRAIYGKCNNPYGHGHNYIVEVTVGGQIDAQTGMVCNLVELDDCVRREILDRFDNADLNHDPLFVDRVPTTENLCIQVHQLIDAAFHKAELILVRIEETNKNSFEYPVDRRFTAG